MAFVQYLVFDGVALPLPDSYEVQLVDVEADSGGETEAGTTQRDVVRLGVLTGFKQREKVSVGYFDTEALEMKEAEMFVEGYKAVLVKDTSFKGLWKVSFTLKEF